MQKSVESVFPLRSSHSKFLAQTAVLPEVKKPYPSQPAHDQRNGYKFNETVFSP